MLRTKEEKRELVDKVDWFHCIDVGDGVTTKGMYYEWSPDVTGKTLLIGDFKFSEQDFKGKTVLDNAAWDGLYSFGAEELGAKRVLAVDSWAWQDTPWPGTRTMGTKAGFDLACSLRQSHVESKKITPETLTREEVGVFDMVLVFGLIYHLRNPILALQNSWSVTQEVMCVESLIDQRFGEEYPYAVFYPGSEMNNDSTNWWGPNLNCLKSILTTLDPPPRLVELVFCFPTQGTSGDAKNRIVGYRAAFKAWR